MNKKLLMSALLMYFAGCSAMDSCSKVVDASSRKQFEQTDRQCPICTQKIESVMITLPCGHQFCEVCINTWRAQHSKMVCPICRCEIPVIAVGPHARVVVCLPPERAKSKLSMISATVSDAVLLNRALLDALFTADFGMASRLLKKGADMRCENDLAMRRALEFRDWPLVHWLIENGVDVHFDHDAPMLKALDPGASIYRDWDEMCFLIKHGVDVHFDNDAPMKQALRKRDFKLIRWLIEHGVDVHFSDDAPMRLALERNDQSTIDFCLRYGGFTAKMLWSLAKMDAMKTHVLAGLVGAVVGIATVSYLKRR